MAQALSKAEKLEKVRAKARAAGKVPAGDKKKPVRKALTSKEIAQRDIDRYKSSYNKGKKVDDRPLSSLTHYGKPSSTATSGGSKAVRKVDGKAPVKKPAQTAESMVDELRDKPIRYIKNRK